MSIALFALAAAVDGVGVRRQVAEPVGFVGRPPERVEGLRGAAVTSIQIDGVLHEFSSIPGVTEDVTDLVLNVKQLALRMHGDGPKRMALKAKGPGAVTASKIETGPDIEILNPDHVLCHLDKGAEIRMEMTVESGKGYVPASQSRPADAPIGLIPVDAIFSPVRKVSYKVDNARVGQVTDYMPVGLPRDEQHKHQIVRRVQTVRGEEWWIPNEPAGADPGPRSGGPS